MSSGDPYLRASARSPSPSATVTIAAPMDIEPRQEHLRRKAGRLKLMTILWPNAESDNPPSGFSEERRNAWFDARLAPALPPDHRTRRQDSWQAGGRDAVGRGTDPSHHLCGYPQARAQGLADAGARRHQARRPCRNDRLEHLAPS